MYVGGHAIVCVYECMFRGHWTTGRVSQFYPLIMWVPESKSSCQT